MRILKIAGVLCLWLALVSTSAFAGEGEIRKAANPVFGEYIVVLNEGVRDLPAVASEIAKKQGGVVRTLYKHALRGFHVLMPEGRALAMSHDPRVKWVEENTEVFLSSVQSTRLDPACNANCTTTSDNRLWHLDRLDGASPANPDNNYNYCSTTSGDGVHIYVVDSGVERAHQEFGTKLVNNQAVPRVRDGFNATVRYDPNTGVLLNDEYDEPIGDWRNDAHQPCGTIYPSTDSGDSTVWSQEIGNGGHGTSVASIAAGKKVGVAKDAWIVPVKIFRCDRWETRKWQPQHAYVVGDRVSGASVLTSVADYYLCVRAGVSKATEPTFPNSRGTSLAEDPDDSSSVVWKKMPRPPMATADDVLAGMDWILGPDNPTATLPGVVNMSFFLGTAGSTSTWDATKITAFEVAVNALTNHGMIVVASANNQGDDACTKSPARMSAGNPNSAQAAKVITVGGTMLRNNPEVTLQNQSVFRGDGSREDGTNAVGPEPVYNGIPADTKDARWVCGLGDSAGCGSATTGSPSTPASNYGLCVSVFAPAKNITPAVLPNSNSYRDRLARASDDPIPAASGTSFSAPLVAGIAAMFLQHAPNATPDDFLAALQLNGVSGQMEDSLNAPLNGSPNLMARAVGVYAYSRPPAQPIEKLRNSTTNLEFKASGPSLAYHWYRGPVGNTSSSVHVNTGNPFPLQVTQTATYWARAVSSTCADAPNSVDSGAYSVVVTEPTIAAPASLSAQTSTATTTQVVLSWASVTDAVDYQVQRRDAFGSQYLTIATVTGTSYTDTRPDVAATAYFYQVRARDAAQNASAPSPIDYATVASTLFAETAIVTNSTTVKPDHITELRAAVAAIRKAADGTILTWPALEAKISAAHINGIRTALQDARAIMGLPNYPFTLVPAGNGSFVTGHLTQTRDSFR